MDSTVGAWEAVAAPPAKRASAGSLGLRAIALACVVGLAFRALVFAVVAYRNDVGDASTYDLIARNILRAHVFSAAGAAPFEPTLYRGPVYPGFLAIVYLVFGRSAVIVQAIQALFGVATVVLLAVTASRVAPRIARWVLWVGMLSPFDAVYQGAILTESLTTLLLVSGIVAPFFLRGWKRWAAMAVLVVGAALAREVYLLLVPFGGVAWIVLRRIARRPPEIVQTLGVLAAFSVLAVTPWTIRNYELTGKIVPIAQGGAGSGLWMGSWATDDSFTQSDASGKRVWPDEAFLHPEDRSLVEQAYATQDLRERDRVLMALFKARFRAEPFRVMARWFVRAPRLWMGTRFEIFSFRPAALAWHKPLWYVVKAGLWGLNALALAGAIVGFFVAVRRRDGDVLWLAVPILYTIVVYLPFNSFEPRYSQPAFPFVLVLLCYGARAIADRVGDRFGVKT